MVFLEEDFLTRTIFSDNVKFRDNTPTTPLEKNGMS